VKGLTVRVLSYSDKPLVKVYKDSKELLEISLEDNGVHVRLLDGKRYVLFPSPDIESQVEQIVEKVVDLGNDDLQYFFGNDSDMQEVGYLLLGDPWFDREKLALIASKHVAVFSGSKTGKVQTVVGVTRYLPDLVSATVIRKDDGFPLGQVLVDYSQRPPKVKLFNELGELSAELEGQFELDELLEDKFELDNSVLVYREQPESVKSPMIIENEDKVYYATTIFRFLLAVKQNSNDGKAVRIASESQLKSSLYALLYLDRMKGGEGVEIYVHPYAVPLSRLEKTIKNLKSRINKKLNKLGISREIVSGYEPILKSLKEYKYLDALEIRVVPIAFLIVTSSWESFMNYTERIATGPVKDGEIILSSVLSSLKGSQEMDYLPKLLTFEQLLYLVLDSGK